MTRISVSDAVLTVEIEGLHRLWGLTRRLRVPLAHVRGATVDPGIVHEPKGLRSPGLYVPGSVVIGTFMRDGERHFWDVSSGARAVVIELAGDTYDRLILDVEDPRGTVDMVNRALLAWKSSGSPLADPSQPPVPWVLRPQFKAALAGAMVVDGVMKTVMLVDIGRRPPESLRGSQRMWRALAFVNLFGPLAYFTVGRRPSPVRRHR